MHCSKVSSKRGATATPTLAASNCRKMMPPRFENAGHKKSKSKTRLIQISENSQRYDFLGRKHSKNI